MSPNLIGSVALYEEEERERDLSLHVHAPKKGHGGAQREGPSVGQGDYPELNHPAP